MNKQEVDAAIEFFEVALSFKKMGERAEDIETALTALKFMRLMMEPSDGIIVSAINGYYESSALEKDWHNAIRAATEAAWQEVSDVES